MENRRESRDSIYIQQDMRAIWGGAVQISMRERRECKTRHKGTEKWDGSEIRKDGTNQTHIHRYKQSEQESEKDSLHR